ncbi:MAG: O-methyltransferase [Elusimicrobia bacterium]|nr:O-methyltransferase [Elusimicrobiota bacterium]
MRIPERIPEGAGYQSEAMLSFFRRSLKIDDPAQSRMLERMNEEGLPAINIGAIEGRILELLARSCGASKAVEIGTLGGYSALWISRGLAEAGRLWSIELDAARAAAAAKALAEAGCSGKVSVLAGNALDHLPRLEAEGPFDFCFIDADKSHYPDFLRWATRNLRTGGIVAADNVFLFGKAHLPPSETGEYEEIVAPMREFLAILSDRALFQACALIPTPEGLALGVKR